MMPRRYRIEIPGIALCDVPGHFLVAQAFGRLAEMSMSRIEALMAERTAARAATASTRALAALSALKGAGVSGWVIGSLARGEFRLHSDVDFLVDCDRRSKHAAFRIIEGEMGDVPFHFISARDLNETTRRQLMKEAADATSIRARTRPPG